MALNNLVAPGIAIYNNILPDGEQLMADLEYSVETGVAQWVAAQVASHENDGPKENKYHRDTSSMSAPMPPYGGAEPDLYNSSPRLLLEYGMGKTFRDAFEEPLREYLGHFGIEIRDYDSYQILKYGVGQKFGRHVDDHWRYHRRVSLTWYANDSYEGGEIEFDQFDLKIKPEKGTLLLFPSTYAYSHIVHPVTSGTRYAVVQWMR